MLTLYADDLCEQYTAYKDATFLGQYTLINGHFSVKETHCHFWSLTELKSHLQHVSNEGDERRFIFGVVQGGPRAQL